MITKLIILVFLFGIGAYFSSKEEKGFMSGLQFESIVGMMFFFSGFIVAIVFFILWLINKV